MRYAVILLSSILLQIFQAVSPLYGIDCQETQTDSDVNHKRQTSSRLNLSQFNISYDVCYGTIEEAYHRGDIYVLKEHGDEPTVSKRPAILVIHGGAWTLGDKVNDAIHAVRLAQRGYWVMSINYRLAPKHKYPAQLEDCRTALKWVVENADRFGIDSDRIGLWGYSAGGHLSSMLALDPAPNQPSICAAVCGGAPFDLTQLPPKSTFLAGVFGASREKLPDAYYQASPLFKIREGAPPLFLFHGSKDWLVPESISQEMKRKLDTFSVPNRLEIVENKGHLGAFVDPLAAEKSYEFLDQYLMPDSTWRTGVQKSE